MNNISITTGSASPYLPTASSTPVVSTIEHSPTHSGPVSPTFRSDIAAAHQPTQSESHPQEASIFLGMYRWIQMTCGSLSPYGYDKHEVGKRVRTFVNANADTVQPDELPLNSVLQELFNKHGASSYAQSNRSDEANNQGSQQGINDFLLKCEVERKVEQLARTLINNFRFDSGVWEKACQKISTSTQADTKETIKTNIKMLKTTFLRRLVEQRKTLKEYSDLVSQCNFARPDSNAPNDGAQDIAHELPNAYLKFITDTTVHIEKLGTRIRKIGEYEKKLSDTTDMENVLRGLREFINEYIQEFQSERVPVLEITNAKTAKHKRMLWEAASLPAVASMDIDRNKPLFLLIQRALQYHEDKVVLNNALSGEVTLCSEIKRLQVEIERGQVNGVAMDEQIRLIKTIKGTARRLIPEALSKEWEKFFDCYEHFMARRQYKTFLVALKKKNPSEAIEADIALTNQKLKNAAGVCVGQLTDIVFAVITPYRQYNLGNKGMSLVAAGTRDDRIQAISQADNANFQQTTLENATWHECILREYSNIAQAQLDLLSGSLHIMLDSQSAQSELNEEERKRNPQKLANYAASMKKTAVAFGELKEALENQAATTSLLDAGDNQELLESLLSDLMFWQFSTNAISDIVDEYANILRGVETADDARSAAVADDAEEGDLPDTAKLPEVANLTLETASVPIENKSPAVSRQHLAETAKNLMQTAHKAFNAFHYQVSRLERENCVKTAVEDATNALNTIRAAQDAPRFGTYDDSQLVQWEKTFKGWLALYTGFSQHLMSRLSETEMLQAAYKENRLAADIPRDGHAYFRSVSPTGKDYILELVVDVIPFRLELDESGKEKGNTMALKFPTRYFHIHVQKWVDLTKLHRLERRDIVCAHFKRKADRFIGSQSKRPVHRATAEEDFAIDLVKMVRLPLQ